MTITLQPNNKTNPLGVTTNFGIANSTPAYATFAAPTPLQAAYGQTNPVMNGYSQPSVAPAYPVTQTPVLTPKPVVKTPAVTPTTVASTTSTTNPVVSNYGSTQPNFSINVPNEIPSTSIGSSLTYSDVLNKRNKYESDYQKALMAYADTVSNNQQAIENARFSGDTVDFGLGAEGLAKRSAGISEQNALLRAQGYGQLLDQNTKLLNQLSPQSLSEGQTLVDPLTGRVITQNGGTSTLDQSGVVDAWATGVKNGTYKITDVPAEYRNAVAQAAQYAPSQISDTSKNVVSLIDQLLGRNTAAISGIPGLSSFIPGTDAQLTKNLYNQLKSTLSLENRQLLKGSGAISDFEFKVLERAASSLGRNLSDKDFISELQKLKAELTQGQGGQGVVQTKYGAINTNW